MSFKIFLISRFSQGLLTTLFLFSLVSYELAATTNTTSLLQQGQDSYQHGDFVKAISHWQSALDKTQPGSRQRLNTLVRLAVAYQKVGNNYTTAYTTLQQALALAQESGKPAWQVLVHSYLGDLFLVMQQPDAAIDQLEANLPLART